MNTPATAIVLAHGTRLSFNGLPFQVCTSRGFWENMLSKPGSYYAGRSVEDLMAESRERHPHEPEHSIFACAVVLYDGPRRAEEPRIAVEIGTVVEVEGRLYEIGSAPNRNLRLLPLEPEVETPPAPVIPAERKAWLIAQADRAQGGSRVRFTTDDTADLGCLYFESMGHTLTPEVREYARLLNSTRRQFIRQQMGLHESSLGWSILPGWVYVGQALVGHFVQGLS